MRTIRTKVYKFEELSNEAKAVAIENYRNNGNNDYDYIWNDAENTVKEFVKLFDISIGHRSWLEFNSNMTDEVDDLSGLRLQKWLYNNLYNKLFKNAYLRNFDGHKKHKNITNQVANNTKKEYCSYYSSWKVDNSCVLTGVCYDDDILAPIYDFLKLRKFDNTTLLDLISECYSNLRNSIESEIEYNDSDDNIEEELIENDYEFTINGNRF